MRMALASITSTTSLTIGGVLSKVNAAEHTHPEVPPARLLARSMLTPASRSNEKMAVCEKATLDALTESRRVDAAAAAMRHSMLVSETQRLACEAVAAKLPTGEASLNPKKDPCNVCCTTLRALGTLRLHGAPACVALCRGLEGL